jgi:predicted tellurium resistance membrane protein TerC
MLELLSDPAIWIAFFTLTAMELVLGIDNVIFISILVDKLPPEKRNIARKIGLFGAMFMRIGLLFVLTWIVGMTQPLLEIMNKGFSGRDLVLLGGGLFLLWKSTSEIHEALEGNKQQDLSTGAVVKSAFASIILQIMVIDLVFSLDSIITAVGMVDEIEVMVAAVIASVGMMMLFAAPIGNFVSRHPTVKILALSFLATIGLMLVAEGFGHHIPKGYIYAAMAFSLIVEMLNLRMRKRAEAPVQLQRQILEPQH